MNKRGKIVNRYSLVDKLENGMILGVIVKEVDTKLIFVTVYNPAQIKTDSKETRAKSSK